MEQESVCSPATGNAARTAAAPWMAKANLPAEGSSGAGAEVVFGSRISTSTCTKWLWFSCKEKE